MSLNVVDNSNYGFTEGATKDELKSTPFITSGIGLNANNATTAGIYSVFVSGSGSNLPDSSSCGVLLVVRATTSGLTNDVLQIFFDTNLKKTFTRYYSGSWSSWAAFGA